MKSYHLFADANLQAQFGPIDVYLFDQLLKGRIGQQSRVLDAGCGGGRNLVYLLQNGYDVFGVDRDPQAVDDVRRLAASLAPNLARENFQVASVENIPFAAASFDVVISSAVLHFAESDRQFRAMLHGSWAMLKPQGLFFCRLASSIGMEKQTKRIKGRRFLLPDGSERYLVDAAILDRHARELGAELLDPLKTTVVQDERSMTTWVLKKSA